MAAPPARPRPPPVERQGGRLSQPLSLSTPEVSGESWLAAHEEDEKPRITLGAILVFVATGSTIVAALLGAPDWLIIVILTVLVILALVVPTAIREFGSDRSSADHGSVLANADAPQRTPVHQRGRTHTSDSSSGWFGFDGDWSGDGGSDSSGGSSGGGD